MKIHLERSAIATVVAWTMLGIVMVTAAYSGNEITADEARIINAVSPLAGIVMIWFTGVALVAAWKRQQL